MQTMHSINSIKYEAQPAFCHTVDFASGNVERSNETIFMIIFTVKKKILLNGTLSEIVTKNMETDRFE